MQHPPPSTGRRTGLLALAALGVAAAVGSSALAGWPALSLAGRTRDVLAAAGLSLAQGAPEPRPAPRTAMAPSGAHAVAPALLARQHRPAPLPAIVPPHHLRLATIGGGPVLDVVPFDEQGYMRDHDFAAIAHAFRAPTGCTIPIHPRLIEVLMEISNAFEDRPIVLISGHREPTHGTDTSSYHVAGLAADIAILGVPASEIFAAAVRLGVPGVGRYGAYVHVDVREGDHYRWGGGARGRRARRPALAR